MLKKEIIVLTALSLFNRFSFNSIGVDRIISDADVAKMTFYNNFKSKENIINCCLSLRRQQIKTEISEELSKYSEFNQNYKLKIIFNWYVSWIQSDDFYGCLFQKALVEVVEQYPSTIIEIEMYKQWLHNLFFDLLSSPNVKEPEILSSILINILDGMTVSSSLSKGSIDLEKYWECIEKIINIDW